MVYRSLALDLFPDEALSNILTASLLESMHDASRLGNIDITFLSPPMMDTSQLGQFIERIDMQTPATEAEIRIFFFFFLNQFISRGNRPWTQTGHSYNCSYEKVI